MDFFKEFSKQFTNVARSVTERSKDRENGELSKLNGDIQAAEAALERLFCRYGKACYAQRFGQGSGEDAEALALRVRAKELELGELTDRRDALRELKRCLGCGAVFPKEARYCSMCGKPLPEEAPKPEPVEPGEYCPRCGAARENAAQVCPVCGAAFDAAEEPAAPTARPVVQPAGPDVEEPAQETLE